MYADAIRKTKCQVAIKSSAERAMLRSRSRSGVTPVGCTAGTPAAGFRQFRGSTAFERGLARRREMP
jgi:hypothetical protein